MTIEPRERTIEITINLPLGMTAKEALARVSASLGGQTLDGAIQAIFEDAGVTLPVQHPEAVRDLLNLVLSHVPEHELPRIIEQFKKYLRRPPEQEQEQEQE